MRKILMTLGFCALVALMPMHAKQANARVRFRVRIGARYHRRHLRIRGISLVAPFAGAVWVPGYYIYDYNLGHYIWIEGSWQEPPYTSAIWIAPEYITNYGFVAGHWGHRGDRDRFDREVRERESFRSAPAPAARTFARSAPAPAARSFARSAPAFRAPFRAAPGFRATPAPRAFAPAPAPRAFFRMAPAPHGPMGRAQGPPHGGPTGPHGGPGGPPHGGGGPHGGGPVAHNQHGR